MYKSILFSAYILKPPQQQCQKQKHTVLTFGHNTPRWRDRANRRSGSYSSRQTGRDDQFGVTRGAHYCVLHSSCQNPEIHVVFIQIRVHESRKPIGKHPEIPLGVHFDVVGEHHGDVVHEHPPLRLHGV